MNTSNGKITRQRGFSLVELMVAVVIGLIGTVVMFQVFAVSEAQKRGTASGGDAQQNGSVALYTIERDLRNTAHGMRPLIDLGLPLYTWSDVNNGVLDPTIFRPILITPGANFDSIDVTFSTAEGLSMPVPLMANWNPANVPNSPVTVMNVNGFQLGDQIAICADPAVNPNGVCLRGEVTAISTAANTLALVAGPTPYVVNNENIIPRFNPAAGYAGAVGPRVNSDNLIIPALYTGNGTIPVYIPGSGPSTTPSSATVHNLGQLVTRSYSVQNGVLTLNDGATTTEFASGIVGLRAQYGLDTNGDRAVDAWVDPIGAQGNPNASFTPNHNLFLRANNATIAASWRMVVAARVAVVARGDNMEKEIVETRGTIPLWTNPTGDPAPSYNRVFETIVPFRNMIW
jgi:type IV pilus assembly protein PilW